MHDERKVKTEVDEKTKEQTRILIAKFREVHADIFKHKDEGYMGQDVIAKIDALLELNPELYTVFNYRRKLLLHGWELAAKAEKEQQEAALAKANAEDSSEGKEGVEGSSTTATPANTPTTISAKQKQLMDMEREIKLNTKILLKDYKVYSAWLHRRWLFMRMDNKMKQMFLAKERQQCETLLSVDERNFHAWGYRRWVQNEQRRLANAAANNKDDTTTAKSANKAIGDEANAAELAFTLAKIERNMSNFSAWHNRALIFVELLASIGLASDALIKGVGRSGVVETLTDAELVEDVIGALVDNSMMETELCTRAFYNDPDDQSAWLFVERLVSLLQYASDKVAAGVDAKTAEADAEAGSSTWSVPKDLLDASKGSSSVTVGPDAALLLQECVESCVSDLHECCVALRGEALRSSADGSVTRGMKGIQWPTWLLLHLPKVVTDAAERRKYWDELAIVDPQRQGYYKDMLAKEERAQ